MHSLHAIVASLAVSEIVAKSTISKRIKYNAISLYRFVVKYKLSRVHRWKALFCFFLSSWLGDKSVSNVCVELLWYVKENFSSLKLIFRKLIFNPKPYLIKKTMFKRKFIFSKIKTQILNHLLKGEKNISHWKKS